jgi:hypothetical protein
MPTEGIELADGRAGGGGGGGGGGLGVGAATVFVAGQYISLQEASAEALESGAAAHPPPLPLQDASLRDGHDDGGIAGVVGGREEREERKSLCLGSAGGAESVEDESHLTAWRQFLNEGVEDAVRVGGVTDVEEDAVGVEDGVHLAAWRQFLSEGIVTDVEEDAVRVEGVAAQNSGGGGVRATGGGEASTEVPELSALSQRVDPRTTGANETYNVSKRDLERVASSLSSASSVAHEHCNHCNMSTSALLGAHTSGVEVEDVVGDVGGATWVAGRGGRAWSGFEQSEKGFVDVMMGLVGVGVIGSAHPTEGVLLEKSGGGLVGGLEVDWGDNDLPLDQACEGAREPALIHGVGVVGRPERERDREIERERERERDFIRNDTPDSGEVVVGVGGGLTVADTDVLERGGHHFGHALTGQYTEHFGHAVTGEYMAREPTAGAGGKGADHANYLYWPTNSTTELERGGSALYPEIAALDFLAAWKEREKVRKQVEKDRKRAREKSLIVEMVVEEETRAEVAAGGWRGKEFEEAVKMAPSLRQDRDVGETQATAEERRNHLEASLPSPPPPSLPSPPPPSLPSSPPPSTSKVQERIHVHRDLEAREAKTPASTQVPRRLTQPNPTCVCVCVICAAYAMHMDPSSYPCHAASPFTAQNRPIIMSKET